MRISYFSKHFINSAFAIAMVAMAPFVASAEKLDLSEGTMAIQGRARVTYDSPNISTLGLFRADIDWGFGYFVADQFLLGFNIQAGANFSSPVQLNGYLGPNIMYAFDVGSIIYPYLGLGVGVSWAQGVGTGGTDRWGVGIKPGVGFLVGLNNYVALDLGLSTKFDIPISGATVATGTRLHGAVGHLGFMGFF